MTQEVLTPAGDVTDYGKIKIGLKAVSDAVLELGTFTSPKLPHISKEEIIKALATLDYPKMRVISDYFYAASGIYQTVCNYFAYLYRYDWYIYPENVKKSVKSEKIIEEYNKLLSYLDNTYIKTICGQIALRVIQHGCYYAYILDTKDGMILQELPPDYCRVRFSIGHMPAVEFNMKFFDEKFLDTSYRLKVLKLFPEEFARGYALFKSGKLEGDPLEAGYGWYLLEPGKVIKFNLNNSDIPVFLNAIPTIIDLDAAQALDRKKQMQKLLKILVQKLPMDKNGDLIFDVDEARDIHNTTVEMLRRAIGVDVITTFADVDSIDISDKNTTTSVDDLAKVERSVYDALGISRNLFNTDGNMSLEKSILDDESTLRNLVLQFDMFFNYIIDHKNGAKKFDFRFCMLETTQYNYKELAKQYKELTANGQSKFLPMIALGHSQSSILNLANFENDVLDLPSIMIPPLMSSTMNGEDVLGKKNQTNNNKTQKSSEGAGRPEKPDDQKSDKTIKNLEAQK